MGCTSSTELVTNPITGEERLKKKLGGSYPGQRRPQQPGTTNVVTDVGTVSHFVAYGGGNALKLVGQDGLHGTTTASQPQHIQVTLPDGVTSGETIHVRAPNGQMNAIVIPPGFGPGSTFTVQFAHDTPAPPHAATSMPSYNNNSYIPDGPRQDDGFASGFNNPNWRQQQQQQEHLTASAVSTSEPEVTAFTDAYNSAYYPTASATPVYSASTSSYK